MELADLFAESWRAGNEAAEERGLNSSDPATVAMYMSMREARESWTEEQKRQMARLEYYMGGVVTVIWLLICPYILLYFILKRRPRGRGKRGLATWKRIFFPILAK